MELGSIGHALDGLDAPAGTRPCQHETGEHRLSVEQHGACAALAQLTTVLGAGQAKVFPQYLQQRFVGRERRFDGVPVDDELDVNRTRRVSLSAHQRGTSPSAW